MRDVGAPPDRVLRFMSELRFTEPDGPSTVLSTNPLRAPLRSALTLLLQNQYLGLREKAAAAVIAAPSLAPFAALKRLDDKTVAQWWSQIGGMKRCSSAFCALLAAASD